MYVCLNFVLFLYCVYKNIYRLSPHCKDIVSNFTEVQTENLELNPILMSKCKSIMEKHCEVCAMICKHNCILYTQTHLHTTIHSTVNAGIVLNFL